MISKKCKSLFLFPLLISFALIFSACSLFSGSSGEGSISFKLDKDVVQKIMASQNAVPSGSRAAGENSLFADIFVLGEFQDTVTIPVDQDAEASFTSVPIGAKVYVQAIVYKKDGNTRKELYKGQSKTFTVKRGQNQVVFALKSVNADDGLPPNVLPENIIFVANSQSGGSSNNDGTEEKPLDSIEHAVDKIHELVTAGKAYGGQEWGIVLLSDLTGAQIVTDAADNDIYRLYIASKNASDIKTIDGGFTQTPNNDEGATLTVLTMKDTIIQCVKITGGWAVYGGGIRHLGKRLIIMPGTEISGNKAQLYGAGIYAARAPTSTSTNNIELLIYGGIIGGDAGKGNFCTGRINAITGDVEYGGSGGGIYICGVKEGYGNAPAYLTIEGGLIKGNKASDGGGICVEGQSSVIMNGGTITENTVIMDGGNQYGGGIYLSGERNYDNTSLTLNGGSITANKAREGGGIYAYIYPIAIYGGTVSGNKATNGNGAGIYFNQHNKASPMYFNMHGNPIFGANDYIYLSHLSYDPSVVIPISIDGALTGTSPVATIQIDKYVENHVVIADACTPSMSSSAFAAVCAKFKAASQTKDNSGKELDAPVSWLIDDNGALQKNELNILVSPSGTGDGSDLTVPFGSIDDAISYLISLQNSGTNLSTKDITILVDDILGTKQTVSGTLNAHSLVIRGTRTDNELVPPQPMDGINGGGLEITLEGTPVVLNCIKLYGCNNDSNAISVGDGSNKQVRVVLGDKVLITGNYPDLVDGGMAPVYIRGGASVTMNDGCSIVSNNNFRGDLSDGPCADAVFVDNGASFDMQGGIISQNTDAKGGPFGVRSGIGVYVATGGSFSMGGNAALYQVGDTVYNDIYLSPGTKIRITKDLTSDQCVIMFDDTNASLGDVILEPAAGVDIEDACKRFNLSLSYHPWYLGWDGKLVAVNPNTINFYIQQGGTGDGSASSPFGSIADAIATMSDMSADYILNINGQLSGAQVIENFVSANAIYIKGSGNDAALTGGTDVDNTLTIVLDQYCSVPITISNLTISGAEKTGLVVNNSKQQNAGINPLYRDVILKDGVQIINNGNGTDDYNGGGIYVGEKNILSISNDCIVEDNKAGSTGNGAGAYLYSYACIELKDNVSFAANNDIYVPLTQSIMIGGPLSQSQVATITPCSYELLTAQTASPIMALGIEGFDDNYDPIIISTTTLAEVHSKFSVKPDGTENYQIDNQGYLKRQQ